MKRALVHRTAACWLGIVLLALGISTLTATFAGSATKARPSRGHAATLNSEMEQMLQELLARGGASLRSGAIRLEGVAWDSGEGVLAGTSPFGLELGRSLESALARRDRLESAQGSASKSIGRAILRGVFSVLRSGANVTLSLVDANTGRLLSEVKRQLSPSTLMDLAESSLLPPEAGNAKVLARLIRESIGDDRKAFGLKIRTDRGKHAAYFEGEQLHVVIEADRDCYVRLYHISWTQRTWSMIFPNRSERESAVKADKSIELPARGSRAVFEVSKPDGVDAIVAFASEEPFADEQAVQDKLAGEDGEGRAQPPSDDAEPAVVRVGEFLAEENVSEERAKGVFARGLIVRHRTESDAPSADEVTTTPTDPPHTSASEGTLVAPAAPAVGGRTSKGACFFTTLPKTFVRR